MPGVALGSELILAVERAMTLFAAWMLVIVAVARAVVGELPSEISGRGVRYADADTTQRTATDMNQALDRLDARLESMRRVVFDLECFAKETQRPSRYAMVGKAGMEIEQRIFELLGDDDMRAPELIGIVAREFGVTEDAAFEAARKVLKERGTPQHAATKEIIDRLATVRF